jgi:hypothetical protein
MRKNTNLMTQELRLETTDYETEKTVVGTYEYDKDTFRYHRLRIVTDKGIGGSIYIPRDLDPFPTRLILEYARPESNSEDEE